MRLCSDNHIEVCFEGRECPVCNEQIKTNEVENDLKIANDLNETLKSEIEELKEANCYLEKSINLSNAYIEELKSEIEEKEQN
jgi:hypothetical protein